MPAGASPEPLPEGGLPITVPMWEHDAFGRVGAMATPFGLPASAFYSQGSLQVCSRYHGTWCLRGLEASCDNSKPVRTCLNEHNGCLAATVCRICAYRDCISCVCFLPAFLLSCICCKLTS